MSVYIKGMEMPTSCYKCPLKRREGMIFECPVTHEMFSVADVNILDYRLDNCPIISTPEHGELVDRREMDVLSWHEGEYGTDFDSGVMFVLDKLDELPTIIPADKEGDE